MTERETVYVASAHIDAQPSGAGEVDADQVVSNRYKLLAESLLGAVEQLINDLQEQENLTDAFTRADAAIIKARVMGLEPSSITCRFTKEPRDER